MKNLAVWGLGILEWPLRRRQQRLMKARGSHSKDEFARYFLSRKVPQKIVDEVWVLLVNEAVVDNFKPHPEDNLEKVFGLAEEDRDEDVILVLLQRCGCRIPPTDEALRVGPVDTVADLVDFLVKMLPQQ